MIEIIDANDTAWMGLAQVAGDRVLMSVIPRVWQPKIPITDVGSHFNPQSYIRNAEAAFRNNSVTEFLDDSSMIVR
jgi:hypothetical protein